MNVEIHTLKTHPPYWWAIDSGEKTFDVRRDDRGFQRGDVLHLLCYDPEVGKYMRNSHEHCDLAGDAMCLIRKISWVMTGGQMGIEPGYVVLGLHPSDLEEYGG